MTKTPISLGVQSNPARTAAAGAARFLNCYPDDAGAEGKVKFPVYACNGFQDFVSLSGGGAVRKSLDMTATTAYTVAGNKVWKITSAGVATALAGTVSSSGIVTMARNRRQPDAQIGIVTSDGHYYIVSNDVLTEVTMPVDAASVVALTIIAGYFVLLTENGEFYVTNLDSGTVIDDLDFAAAEANPDGGTAAAVRGQDLVLFGPKSIEFWGLAINADFPVERSSAVNIGCWHPSVCELLILRESAMTDSVAFLGSNSEGAFLGVMLLDGYGATKLSHQGVERAIRSEPTFESIRLFTYTENGHVFLVVTGATFTWSYDTTTGLWHERTSSGLDRWRINSAFAFANKVLLGDYTTGKIYESRNDLYDASNDCVLTVRHSNDNANTWVTRTRTISGASDKKQRIKINRLGMAKEDGKIFDLSISKAVMEDGVANPMTITTPAVHAYPNKIKFDTLYVDALTGVSRTDEPKGILQLAVNERTFVG